jgi:hypothetical protein
VGSDGSALTNWLVIITVALVWYAIVCALYPYKNCRHCTGGKSRPSGGGKTFRMCWSCGGFGGKPRLGTRLFRLTRKRR